jgi:AraC family transcriptional regulator
MSDRVELALLPRTPYEASYVATRGSIGYAFESQRGVHALGSDRRTVFQRRPNSLSFVPRGCDVYSRSEGGGEYLLVHVDGWSPPGARLFNDVFSRDAARAAERIRRGILCGAPDLDEPIAALMDAVTRVCGGVEEGPRAARWITSRRLALLDDLIEASLHEGITVGQLAARLKLSVGFFTRALRAAIGRTPHDYLMDRRVSRARLLLPTARSLADIASACGFSSQAHMTTVFRRRLGVTPAPLRRR